MAYAAFVSTPWVYGVNFHAQELRQHGTPNRVRFGSDSDVNAAAIAAILAGAVVSQQTSLVKRLGEHNISSTHPAGTLYTAKAVLVDSTGAAWSVRGRNFNATAATSADIAALFTGQSSALCTALSAPPTLPNSGNPVATAQVTIIDRS